MKLVNCGRNSLKLFDEVNNVSFEINHCISDIVSTLIKNFFDMKILFLLKITLLS